MLFPAVVGHLEREHVPIVERLPGLGRFSVSVPFDEDRDRYDELADCCSETLVGPVIATNSGAWPLATDDSVGFLDPDETVPESVGRYGTLLCDRSSSVAPSLERLDAPSGPGADEPYVGNGARAYARCAGDEAQVARLV